MLPRQLRFYTFTLLWSVASVTSFSSVSVTQRAPVFASSTCLFAEEDEKAAETKPEKKTSDTDILNSPAFLKRKLEVLKSDLAKAEEDLASAKQRLEEGKVEWGAQLDELEAEVRTSKSLCLYLSSLDSPCFWNSI